MVASPASGSLLWGQPLPSRAFRSKVRVVVSRCSAVACGRISLTVWFTLALSAPLSTASGPSLVGPITGVWAKANAATANSDATIHFLFMRSSNS